MSNITELNLLSVPLEADYKHTLYFNNPKAQEDYFNSRAIYSNLKYGDFSYQRKDHKIRIPKHFDYVNGKVNYVMYKNKAYGDKWFYAFIMNMEYVNDGVTDVYIQTDVMQTWMFDYSLRSCFVEREHTIDDSIGANTVPETLETGEFICNNMVHCSEMDSTCFIVASTVNLSTGADSGINIYNGVLSGWKYYYFNSSREVENALKDLANLRTNDAIVSIFIMPKAFLHIFDDDVNNALTNSSDVPKRLYWDKIEKPTTVNGYTPKNKKLLTYPYSYLLMDNNSGGVATYRYELFEDEDICPFNIYGCITPGASIKLEPAKYNGGAGWHFGLNGGKYPVCGWQSDYYTNWLTQNALNIEVMTDNIHIGAIHDIQSTAVNTGTGLAGNVITQNWAGALNSVGNGVNDAVYLGKKYVNDIKSITAMKEIHSFQSPTVSGAVASGDINFCCNQTGFNAYQMSVKKEFAKILDGYFSVFGYQVNRVKYPNTNHRSHYWYTKTVGCDIDYPTAKPDGSVSNLNATIPNQDIEIIKRCYDNGITFWRDANMIGRYTYIDTEDKNEEKLYSNVIV